MIVISNSMFNSDDLKKQVPILTGQACVAYLSDKDSVEEVPGYVRQSSVAIPNSKRVLTAFVLNEVAENIPARKEVILGPYAHYAFFKRLAQRNKTTYTIYAFVTSTSTFLQSDFYLYHKGNLEKIQTLYGFDETVINTVRQQDYQDSPVHVYSIGDVPALRTKPSYVEYHKANPFDDKGGLKSIWSRFTTLKAQRLTNGAENRLGNQMQDLVLPLSLALFAVVAAPVYSVYKQVEFDSVQAQFHDVANSQEGLPDQSELSIWSARNQFVQSIDSPELTSLVMQDLLRGLSVASQKSAGGSAVFERMDISLESPKDMNGKPYNVILEVGIPDNKVMSAEEQTSRFAKALTESLGSSISGSVDVWDDVIKRDVSGKTYVVARFYLMRGTKNNESNY